MKLLDIFFASFQNNLKQNKPSFKIKKNNYILNILKVLLKHNFILGFHKYNEEELIIFMKNKNQFAQNFVITKLKRISKSSRPVYIKYQDLYKIKKKNSYYILSTSKGLLLDAEALKHKVGGLLICYVV